jgi:hypothetical protein
VRDRVSAAGDRRSPGARGITRDLLTGNAAAAWGARLADVDYVPAYPITPQTEIIETLARWIGDGALQARLVTMDSEHSMLTAAGAAAATGARVFTASSSQGLRRSILDGREACRAPTGPSRSRQAMRGLPSRRSRTRR